MAFPAYIANYVSQAIALLTSRYQKARPAWIVEPVVASGFTGQLGTSLSYLANIELGTK